MQDSLLFDLLQAKLLYNFREELEQQNGDNFSRWVNEARKELENKLNEKQLKLVDKYVSSINLREEEINFNVGIKTLNYGIKIGMQLQKAFDQDKE